MKDSNKIAIKTVRTLGLEGEEVRQHETGKKAARKRPRKIAKIL